MKAHRAWNTKPVDEAFGDRGVELRLAQPEREGKHHFQLAHLGGLLQIVPVEVRRRGHRAVHIDETVKAEKPPEYVLARHV